MKLNLLRFAFLIQMAAIPVAMLLPRTGECEEARPAASSGDEKVNVEAIKEKYWARGDESELGVVQNRLYAKEDKIELGGFFGFVSSDPFLSVRVFGLSAGYHFTEIWSAHLVAWADAVSDSSALTTLRNTGGGADANTNIPHAYYGGEAQASVLYGKLSLLGKAIIHYDLHLLAGLGDTSTETGNYFTPSLGIGQKAFLSNRVSLNIDYRAMYYNEGINRKVPLVGGGGLGQNIGYRASWNHAITIGVSLMIGKEKGDEKQI